MTEDFSFLNMSFFTKASAYPGSVGTFRYRYARDGRMGDGSLQIWAYENTTFPWTEEGVEALRQWLCRKLRERGAEPYRIPYSSQTEKAEDGG